MYDEFGTPEVAAIPMQIVADSSALIALLLRRTGSRAFHRALLDTSPVMSVVTLTETMRWSRVRRNGPRARPGR